MNAALAARATHFVRSAADNVTHCPQIQSPSASRVAQAIVNQTVPGSRDPSATGLRGRSPSPTVTLSNSEVSDWNVLMARNPPAP